MPALLDAPRLRIARIDFLIDANRRELLRRGRFNRESCHGWQRAWDGNPDLHARERTLCEQRGIAQVLRDARDNRLHAAAERAERARLRRENRLAAQQKPTRCATCGHVNVPVNQSAA